jgi:5'-nucleotidase
MSATADPGRVVLVDMDGVLADFDGAVLAGLPPEIERVQRQNFYIVQDYREHRAHVEAVYSHPEFFFNLEIIGGALDGWQRLLDLGYHPRICTAPLTLNPRSEDGKIAWLEQHFVPRFGPDVVDQVIFDRKKYRYPALALIDDRPDVDTNNGEAVWQHVVFDQPYNQVCESQFRLYGWRDPNLESRLAEAIAHAHGPGD